MNSNLAACLADSAAEHPENPALRLGEATWSYDRLAKLARAAGGLFAARGIGPDIRVGLVLPNVPAFPILFYGALWAGATVVPMNPLVTDREVGHYIDDAQMTMIVALDGFAKASLAAGEKAGIEVLVVAAPGPDDRQLAGTTPLDAAPVTRADGDGAVLLYTSGTTGTPKGAQLTHANLRTNAATTADNLAELGTDDVIMGCLPLFHVFGLTTGLNAAVIAGACLALLPRFDARHALAMIERFGVTVFEGVPTMYSGMLAVPEADRADTASLRLCISGGSAMPVEVLRAFEDAFNAPVLEGYGLSETSRVVSFNHPHSQRKAGSIGTPVQGVERRLLDDAGHDIPSDDDQAIGRRRRPRWFRSQRSLPPRQLPR